MSDWKKFKETGEIQKNDRPKNLGLLIVDDEEQIVTTLRETFTPHFQIYSTNQPDRALELFREHRPQIILSDQRMPTMSGTELFGKIKEIDPSTVRILITGYSDINIVIDALNRELCWKYITKPWDIQALRDIVLKAGRHFLDSAGAQRSLFNQGFLGL